MFYQQLLINVRVLVAMETLTIVLRGSSAVDLIGGQPKKRLCANAHGAPKETS